ncbi:MAG: aspartate ammonia-lyase [Vampirovibrionales bacterium]|nr:aspartate ammonia-lyase [Vampirovibrionales bacterium]
MATTLEPQALTRTEKDSIGERQVPAGAYYGIQALRGSENFPMTGFKPAQVYPEAIRAFGWIKKAAAQANTELNLLDPLDAARNAAIGKALMQAADEMIAGRFNDQFIVDVFQGGTGTSNHMNANEILANRASELMGAKLGEYSVNPNDHANYGQSTNDVTPTVMRLTVLAKHDALVESVNLLESSLREKAKQFSQVLIPGRTHMQDAVPLTLGQVFGGYANAIKHAGQNIVYFKDRLLMIGLGASALGTGLNTHPQYRTLVTRYLAQISGFDLRQHEDYFQATSSFGCFTDYSAAMRSVAIELEKIAHDIKLYSSGPKTAIAELKLPSLQPGSSIMPGKINPVLVELMDQVSYAVQGNDYTIALCAQNGQWQLNVMMPLTLIKLVDSMTLLTNGLREFSNRCVAGLEANLENIETRMSRSTILLTALNPYIGYAQAAQIAKKVLNEGLTVREAALSMKIQEHTGNVLTPERLDEILSVEAMTQP